MLTKLWYIILTVIFGLQVGLAALPDAVPSIALEKVQEAYDNAPQIQAKYALEGVALINHKIINPEKDKYKNEPKDEIEVIIGNKPEEFGGPQDFEPNITIKRWNEVSFTIKPDLSDVDRKDKKLRFENDHIIYETPKMNFEMYDYTEGEGGYKYIWILNEKPATNTVEFQIENEGLEFFYQPPLNEENNPEADYCTQTQCFKDGQVIIERPENVVGSYAVYHSTKGKINDAYDKDYKTGQSGFIYRPHLIDSNGLETYGKLHIENGIYRITIPEDFYNNAVYPIKSNDTFGYTTEGSSSVSLTSNYVTGQIYTGANGTGVSMSAYVRNSGDAFKMGLYNGTSFVKGTNETTAGATVSWISSNFTDSPSLSEIAYYLCTHFGAPIYWYYNSGGTYYYQSQSYASGFPDPITWSQSGNSRIFSIYATYTPSGGAAPAQKVPDIIYFD